jgi:hypothetical protein
MPISRIAPVLLVASLVACAAPGRPPAAAPPAAAPAAPTGPIDAAEMAGLADAMCACTDVECGNQVAERVQTAFERSDAPPADADAVQAQSERARGCFMHLGMLWSHAIMQDIITRVADEACACADAACAEAAARRGWDAINELPQVHDETPEHAAADAAFGRQGRRARACYAKLPGADDVAAVEARLDRFATEVCACQAEPACIEASSKSYFDDAGQQRGLLFADTDHTQAAITRAGSCGWPQPE